ncbi:MAG: polysaccharide pyruvyl transferase family protein [Phycisphaerales bacterium]
MLVGFYGRGNCGDEALLQSTYELYKDEFNITIAVDEYGAHPKYREWYPYNRCLVVHQTWNSEFEQDREYAGLIIGGSGLNGATLVAAARSRGIPTILAGIDFPLGSNYAKDPDGFRTYLNLYDRIITRTRVAKEQFDRVKWDVSLGADWAWHLAPDSRGITPDPRRAVVVIREIGAQLADEAYRREIRALLDGLRTQGYRVLLAPFCVDDEKFLSQIGVSRWIKRIRLWTEPKRMAHLLRTSGLVVSAFRLHPLILASDSNVPLAAFRPAAVRTMEDPVVGKFGSFVRELGISMFDQSTDLLGALRDGKIGRSSAAAVEDSKARVRSEIDEIASLIHGRGDSGVQRAGERFEPITS